MPWIAGQKVLVDSVAGSETGLLVLGSIATTLSILSPHPVFQIWTLR